MLHEGRSVAPEGLDVSEQDNATFPVKPFAGVIVMVSSMRKWFLAASGIDRHRLYSAGPCCVQGHDDRVGILHELAHQVG